jgi:hypothetical protein
MAVGNVRSTSTGTSRSTLVEKSFCGGWGTRAVKCEGPPPKGSVRYGNMTESCPYSRSQGLTPLPSRHVETVIRSLERKIVTFLVYVASMRVLAPEWCFSLVWSPGRPTSTAREKKHRTIAFQRWVRVCVYECAP